MALIFQDQFNSDSGRFTDVTTGANVSLSGGAKVIEKTTTGWEQGGTYYTTSIDLALGSAWALQFQLDEDGTSSMNIKFYLRLDNPVEGIFTREGYGVYIEGGNLKFDNGGTATTNDQGTMEKDKVYTIVWQVRPDDSDPTKSNINVFALGGHLSGIKHMGQTEGLVTGRESNFVCNVHSENTVRLTNYIQFDPNNGL